MAPTITKISLK